MWGKLAFGVSSLVPQRRTSNTGHVHSHMLCLSLSPPLSLSLKDDVAIRKEAERRDERLEADQRAKEVSFVNMSGDQ